MPTPSPNPSASLDRLRNIIAARKAQTMTLEELRQIVKTLSDEELRQLSVLVKAYRVEIEQAYNLFGETTEG